MPRFPLTFPKQSWSSYTLKRFFKSFWPVTPNAVVAIIASTIVICPFKESTGHLWAKIKQSSSCCDRVGVICFCLLSNHYKSGELKSGNGHHRRPSRPYKVSWEALRQLVKQQVEAQKATNTQIANLTWWTSHSSSCSRIKSPVFMNACSSTSTSSTWPDHLQWR